MACAASLAVQHVLQKENLLENNRKQGAYLFSLLKERLLSPNSPIAPYVFDIRGGGLWYAVEFEVPPEKMKGQKFAMLVQARCMDNGLVIMGFSNSADLEGTKGDHCMLSPAYNVTQEEVCMKLRKFVDRENSLPFLMQVEKIADLFVRSIEEVAHEYKL